MSKPTATHVPMQVAMTILELSNPHQTPKDLLTSAHIIIALSDKILMLDMTAEAT